MPDRSHQQGLLWLPSDSKQPLPAKIREGLDRYKRKHGGKPAHIYVNPSDCPKEGLTIRGVPVSTLSTVLAGHVWLVQEDTHVD